MATDFPPSEILEIARHLGVAPITRVDRRRSTQHVWYASGHPAGPATLKWYRNGPRPQEAAALAMFDDAGIAVPEVYRAGDHPHPFLLAAFLSADPMPAHAAARWFPAAMRLATEVSTSGADLPPLSAGTDLPVIAALDVLTAAGFTVPDVELLHGRAPSQQLLPAHGAFRPANVLSVGGRLHLLGPLGFAAPEGRDGGFWAVHACADPTDLLEVDRWVRQAATLTGQSHNDTLWWAGVGLLLHAAAGWERQQAAADEAAALVAAARGVLGW